MVVGTIPTDFQILSVHAKINTVSVTLQIKQMTNGSILIAASPQANSALTLLHNSQVMFYCSQHYSYDLYPLEVVD